MAAIKIERFSGVRPRASADKLAIGEAQYSRDMLTEGLDIRPIRQPGVVTWMHGARRIYQWKGRWLGWIYQHVRVVASPVANDLHERIYWTNGAGAKAKFATRDTLVGSTDMSALGDELGVPRPLTAPVIDGVPTASTDEAVAVTLSQTSPVHVTTGVDHPFKDGQRVVLSFVLVGSGVDPQPPPGVGMSEINGKEFTVRVAKDANTGVLNTREFDLIGANGANYSAYEPANWQAKIMRVVTDSDMESRSYVWTFVTERGEESQPSDPSPVVDVLKGAAVKVKLTSVPADPRLVTARLYRSVTGPGGTNFFLVSGKTDIGGVGSPATVTFVDETKEEAIGELLPSTTWAPPPIGLDGLTAMPNGFLAGFVGNTIYFCEPYQPHAWPEQYKRTVQDDVVGMAVYGQTLVIATKGKPYMASGADPASVSLSQLDVFAPCQWAPSVVSVGTGVVYHSGEGLIHVSAGGVRNLTEPYLTAGQWQALAFNVTAACWHDGRLFLGVNNADTVVIAIHRDGLDIGTWSAQLVAAAVSTEQYLSFSRGTMMYCVGNQSLNAFERGYYLEIGKWVSGIVRVTAPTTFAVAQVFASDYPTGADAIKIKVHAARALSGDAEVALTYPAADSSAKEYVVTGPAPFRLEAGFLAREWRIDITSKSRVQSVVLASSMGEIRQV